MPSSLWAYLDDMATLMRHTAASTSPDKIFAATKSATMKTTGVMSDDLAIKSKGVIGIDPKREIPIVGKIFKKCLLNLTWILPSIVGVSILAPAALPFITAGGGAFLAYEGAESLHHLWQSRKNGHHSEEDTNSMGQTPEEIETELVNKQSKIGVINSMEMTLIAMATLGSQPVATQIPAVIGNAVAMAGVVHGVVLTIVRMDDMGLHLASKEGKGILPTIQRSLGKGMLKTLPMIMNQLPTLGLGAMFTVGGELVGKHIPAVEHVFHAVEHTVEAVLPSIPVVTGLAEFAVNASVTGAFGLAVGFTTMKTVEAAAPYIGPPLKKVFALASHASDLVTSPFKNKPIASDEVKMEPVELPKPEQEKPSNPAPL